VLHRLNSAATLIQRTTTEAPRGHMYYIGLDVHKKTISYCVKDVSGRIQQEGNVDSTRTGLLDEEFATAMDGSDGSDDLQRLDLRSSASARHPDQGGTSIDAASDCSGQEKERPDRCQQGRRLLAMRLPPGMPHDACSDTGSKAHLEVPASAGAADDADDEPCLWPANRDR
jgi:hypothetical protein